MNRRNEPHRQEKVRPIIRLNGPQQSELRKILTRHFDASALNFLLKDYFDVDLTYVVRPMTPFNEQIFTLIRWLDSTGRMEKFLRALDEISSENPDVRDFLQRLRPP